ncbi:tyrosine-type recombinase/integrase [Novispirillum sp. DQ9]
MPGQETGAELWIPLHPELVAILAEAPADNMAFLMTAQGKPFSAAGFGTWFGAAARSAGLQACSAHGLRKAAARRLAGAGCTHKQIATITGHKSLREIERYTVAADQKQLAAQAVERLGNGRVDNHPGRLAKSEANPLKKKGGKDGMAEGAVLLTNLLYPFGWCAPVCS